MKSLQDLPLENADVVVRVDFNVPINPEGKVIDDTRLKCTLPTLEYLIHKNCRIILLSHLGRPEGIDPNLSLQKIVPNLEKILHRKINFFSSYEDAKNAIPKLPHPSIILCENLRYNEAEEEPKKQLDFAKQLSQLGEFFINDAFACAHREHSSITEITKYFPNKKAAGLLLKHEVDELKKVLKPLKPFYLLLGGSKISTKIGIITSLLPKADAIFIGGAMAFPFVQALDIATGGAKHDLEQIEQAKKIFAEAHKANIPIYLPTDWVCKEDIKNPSPVSIFHMKDGIPNGFQAYDIGPETIISWSEKLQNAKTIFWNGPFGMYEVAPFDHGTASIAKQIANLDCISIVGGGDSVAAIEKQHLSSKFTHLSTGGGASLEFLEKGSLPGIEALK